MTRRKITASGKQDPPQASDPLDVVEGIPDRSNSPALWKYLVLLLIFLAWLGLLVFLGLAGAR